MTGTSFDFTTLINAYAAGTLSPVDVAQDVLARIKQAGDDKVWIARVPEADLLARAGSLAVLSPTERGKLPLFGLPFAVKDNIDVAGMPTTAACPAFAYTPATSATVVERLIAAGALLIGKTNLDQFATGLVGVRSPYGVPRNAIHPDYVPGGSSSGSAVAVSAGLVAFALGTDTAGSGRVPAGFNNVVGLKPTRGLISCAGVVPACRTLDCVSVFALTADDAYAVLRVAAAPDSADPYSRDGAVVAPARPARFRFGVPRADQREFFGDEEARIEYERGIARLVALGGTPVDFDYTPFLATAKLLYDGPWVAERYAVIRELHARDPDAIHPVTRKICENGLKYSAPATFEAFYRLEALRAAARGVWAEAEVLFVPTSGTIYTVKAVEAEPIKLNSNLGYYTNFVNFLDLSAIAVPGGFRQNRTAMGGTLIAPPFAEGLLVALGAELHAAANLTMGATGHRLPAVPSRSPAPPRRIEVAVVGAHLAGQPLNHQLTAIGATCLRKVRTAPAYRFYALPGEPARPGLTRVAADGARIEAELWSVPAEKFGGFVSGIPAPLGIGKVQLDDGTTVCGFICEPLGLAGARDITEFGGWRAYRASLAKTA
jgi:allophanate hydrolase